MTAATFKQLVCLLLVITTICNPKVSCAGNVNVPVDFEDSVADFMNTGIDCLDNPGLTVSVVVDGETILARLVHSIVIVDMSQ